MRMRIAVLALVFVCATALIAQNAPAKAPASGFDASALDKSVDPCVDSHSGEGTTFRVDLNLGNTSGELQSKPAYIWLCPQCAQVLNPTIEVVGSTVKVRLSFRHECPPSTRVN